MTTLGIFVAIIATIALLRFVYAKYALENLDVRLSISAATATEGDVLILTEVLTNSKWLPLPWLAVKFQVDRELDFADHTAAVVSDLYYRNDLFHILMHQKITRRLAFTCAKRGYYAIRGLEITGWDVLVSQKYIRRYDCDTRLTVYPSTLEPWETEKLCTRAYGHLRTKHPIHPDPFSFRGIREYSSNDPMKSINHKASAKALDLMVNVWDFANARQVVLMLDTERYMAWYNETLDERAIKIAASLAEQMTAQGIPIAFITNADSILRKKGMLQETSKPEYTRLPEGRGTHQMRAILESLAYCDINAPRLAQFSNIIAELITEGKIEPEYWFISPYYDKTIDEALDKLRDIGARTTWIMPAPMPKDADFADRVVFV